MSDTGFKTNNGTDLVNIYTPIGTNTAISNTGYFSSGYNKDLAQIEQADKALTLQVVSETVSEAVPEYKALQTLNQQDIIKTASEIENKDIEEEVIEIKRLQKIIEDHTLKLTHITAAQLEKIYKRKIDWFIDSKKALKLGIIDEVI